MKFNYGLNQLSMPVYDKKLWLSDSFFEPPTIRSVASLVCDIAGSATGQSWWLGILDDALFASLDIVVEDKDVGEVATEFGKAALTNTISVGLGAASNGLSSLAGNISNTAAKVATQAAISASSAYISQVSNSYINALSYSAENGWSMDWDNANNSWFSNDTLAATLGAGISTGISTGLNEFNLGVNNSNVHGFNSNQIDSIKNLNNLAGGLASSAVSFAFTGNATFNILNLTDFGTRINGGLLELTVGKDGISSKIGNGGTNISYSTIKSSISGASSLHKNSQINKTGYDKQTKDALRSQWGFGDKTAKKQLEEIIKGDIILKLDADGSEVAQSINENGQKIIHINSSQNEGFIDLGLTLQHEAHRDGIISDEQSQYIETVNAVAGHTKMALAMTKDSLYTKDMLNHISSDTNLQNDINAYLYAAYTGNTSLFAGYVGASYDSSADYWKFTKEGNIYWDGSDNLYDENGKLLHEYSGTGTGHTDALAESLGITHSEANQMLVDADYSWNSQKKTFVDSNGNDIKNDSSKAAITSDMIKVRYDFQHNYVDKLNGAPMHSSVMRFQNDMILGNQNIAVSSDFYKSKNYSDFITNCFAFANEYDKAMEKYGNVGNNKITNEIFDKIAMDFDNKKFNNDNYFYKFAEQISPVVGTKYITTMYKYDDGSLHSNDLNSLAIDFGTWGKDLPLVTTEYETVVINNSIGFKSTSGYNLTTYSDLFSKYYTHLQYNSNAYKQIFALNQKAYNSNLWTYQLPPNYQFGNVGTSGELGLLWDGPHVHMQYKRLNP